MIITVPKTILSFQLLVPHASYIFLVFKTKINGLIHQELFRSVADTYREEKTKGKTRNIVKKIYTEDSSYR